MAQLARLRSDGAQLIKDFLAALDFSPDEATDSQRELIATLVFGLVDALARKRKLLAPQTQILYTALLEDVFKYSSHDAIDFAAFLMRASVDRTVHPLSHGIIGLGMEAYGHWVGQDDESLSQVMIRLLDLVKAHSPAE